MIFDNDDSIPFEEELPIRNIKPIIKNDDLDRKKWHNNNIHIGTYGENSRNEVERSIKEMLEDNRKEY